MPYNLAKNRVLQHYFFDIIPIANFIFIFYHVLLVFRAPFYDFSLCEYI